METKTLRIRHPEAKISGLCLVLGLLLNLGCGADNVIFAVSPDAGTQRPGPSMDASASPPPLASLIVEDFDNKRQLDSEMGNVEVDANQGIATLSSKNIPALEGTGVESYEGRVESDGLIEAESILIHEEGLMIASDSLELRATDQVRISGRVRAGRGGITVIASRSIAITGELESDGPVQLIVTSEKGMIEIAGRILTYANIDQERAPDITLAGRGQISIQGELQTFAPDGTTGGSILINVYDNIRVSGFGAYIAANAEPEGTAGAIQLKSESEVYLEEGARLGSGSFDPMSPDKASLGGDIDVQGSTIVLGEQTHIIAGAAAGPWAGSVLLAASNIIQTQASASIRAGYGQVGGSIWLKAREMIIGPSSIIEPGEGVTQAGNTSVEAKDAVTLQSGATLWGGRGECTIGGDLRIRVGGLLQAEPGATVAAGEGGNSLNAQCGALHPQGALRIDARAATGLDQAISYAIGMQEKVTVNIDPELSVPAPNLTVSTSGILVTRTFDRGASLIGLQPQLLELQAFTPDKTSVVLELSGASSPDGPFDDWKVLSPDQGDDLSDLREAQYFRYRLLLSGRTFDAPVIDHFSINLAP